MQPKSRLHSMKVSSRIASDNKLRVRQWKRKTTAKISACHWIHRTASCRISKQKCQSQMGLSPKEQKKRFMNKGQSFWFRLSFVILQVSQIRKKTVLCHFLSAPRLMKKVAERIFIAPPIWISCCCNHSLLYKSCIAVHQVDDVGMVLGVLVL